ncbi:hypothetical protein OROHE_000715 [Orobanche hederae]
MSRPMLLVLLLLILIITSQFEWRQQLVGDMDTNPTESQKQLPISKREEVFKEKIILTQEKKIHRLREVIDSLKEQLKQCRCTNQTWNINGTLISSLTENNVIQLDRQQFVEEEQLPDD